MSELLEGRLPELPKKSRSVALYGSGCRSKIAASILKRDGFDNVKSLAGGLFAWSNVWLPVA